MRLQALQRSQPHRAHVQSAQTVPPHCNAIRQDSEILSRLPISRRRKALAATLCQQDLTKKVGMAKRKFAIAKYELVVRRSRTGRGLFTVDPIERGRCIVEYTGRVLSEAEEYTSNSKYLFAVNKRKTIDGREKTNIARYINHACRPNCEIEIWRGCIYVMAKRTIKPGEELFYDYGAEYFNEHIRPKG